ncbi:uncharacterized protein [Spinacia oleracea]|uniref:Uncharacterized protein n=1 Tax=Spinacia oleracea TaxID=3562 RepID=A0ABM3R8N5_SPIOL|nr:uncharacterized protein LOC110776326 [Spinacia oleracea]
MKIFGSGSDLVQGQIWFRKLQSSFAVKAFVIILFLLASFAPDFTQARATNVGLQEAAPPPPPPGPPPPEFTLPTNVGWQEASPWFSSTDYKVRYGNILAEERTRNRRTRPTTPPPPREGVANHQVLPPTTFVPSPPPPPPLPPTYA